MVYTFKNIKSRNININVTKYDTFLVVKYNIHMVLLCNDPKVTLPVNGLYGQCRLKKQDVMMTFNEL